MPATLKIVNGSWLKKFPSKTPVTTVTVKTIGNTTETLGFLEKEVK